MGQPLTAAVRYLSGEREPVRVATTGNISLQGLFVVDDVDLEVGDRVLVRAQTDPTQNGIYLASEGVWFRAPDASWTRSINKGTTVNVQEGTGFASRTFVFQSQDPVVGKDPIAIAAYFGTSAPLDVGTTAGTVAAGDDERIELGGTSVQPGDIGTAAAKNIEFFAQQSDVGSPDGIAPLGADSKVPVSFLPDVPFDIGGTIHDAVEKSNLVDTDLFALSDSESSWGLKKLSWSALRTKVLEAVKSFFNATGAAPVYACRAWVNFNGVGTVAIRGSGNVSSITDNGVGNYTINFATPMPDANYSVVFGMQPQPDNATQFTAPGVSRSMYTQQSLNTASSCRVFTGYLGSGGSSKEDFTSVHVAIFG